MRVARAHSPRGEVVLRQREDALELRVNGVFVMDTAETATERALALGALRQVPRPERVLVGGLGLGFTATAVLTDPRVRHLEVVEIEAAVIEWLREGTIAHGPQLLADPRLQIRCADVAAHLAGAAPACYDLVLLDVDNGPGYLVHEQNAALYARPALVEMARVLRPGGAVALWSAARAPELAEAMASVFTEVSATALPVRLQDRDEQYWLYAGRVSESPSTGWPPAG